MSMERIEIEARGSLPRLLGPRDPVPQSGARARSCPAPNASPCSSSKAMTDPASSSAKRRGSRKTGANDRPARPWRRWPSSTRRSGPRRSSSSTRPGRAASPSRPSTSGNASWTRPPSASTSTSPWSGRSRRSRGTYAVAFLESLGVPVVNPLGVARACEDKFQTSLLLAPGRRRRPPLRHGLRRGAGPAGRRGAGRLPVVLKPPLGSWGRLLAKVNDDDALEASSSTRTSWGRRRRRPIYLQEFVRKPGRDIRAFVVDGETIGAIYRNRPLDHQHRPRRRRRGPVRGRRRSSAALCRRFRRRRRGLLAVDLFESERGLLVNEVNHTMEFRNSEEPTGVNIAGAIIDHCLAIVKAGKGRSHAVEPGMRPRFHRRRLGLRRRRAPPPPPPASARRVASGDERTARRPAVSPFHPNLRGPDVLTFVRPEDLEPCDLLFLALPNGESMRPWTRGWPRPEKIIDLGADFRLADPRRAWKPGTGRTTRPRPRSPIRPGIPEIYADPIRGARCVAGPGCEAIVSILCLLSPRPAGLIAPEARSSSTPRWEAPRPATIRPTPPTIRSGRASSAPTSRPATATRPRSSGRSGPSTRAARSPSRPRRSRWSGASW